ncbi:hypothetical protein ROD_14021 [Citrobacter rodentium ICC168]|uniref:Uncharacterized protein n=1 Tax=Citrobacter rodentium (strain ICC168) TaxID=637910 RepID=D2THH1_CITRI|nr:hypothetical protein ROD_14021 [Citrobacter rodentium ICC168]
MGKTDQPVAAGVKERVLTPVQRRTQMRTMVTPEVDLIAIPYGKNGGLPGVLWIKAQRLAFPQIVDVA